MVDHFEQYGSDYRDIHNLNLRKTGFVSSYFAERKVREVVRQVKDANSPLRILDLGCGDGECIHFFEMYFPGSRIYGLDVSENSLRADSIRHGPIPFILYDGKRIPFENESFDIILIANVLHHVPDIAERRALLKECRRTLKTLGKLFIFEHSPFNPLTRRIVSSCPFDSEAKLINHISMKNMLKRQGLTCKCRFILFVPGFLKRFDSLERYLNWCPLGGQYYVTAEKE